MAKTQNIALQIGIDKRYDCTILNTAETQVVDITGWAISWLVKVRESDLDASAILTKTTANGGVTITGVYNASPTLNAQVARVSINDEETDAMTEALYHHELRRTDAGFETPLIEGSLHIHP